MKEGMTYSKMEGFGSFMDVSKKGLLSRDSSYMGFFIFSSRTPTAGFEFLGCLDENLIFVYRGVEIEEDRLI